MAAVYHWPPDAILDLTARELLAWQRKVGAFHKAVEKAASKAKA
jgi:hypothetical protein